MRINEIAEMIWEMGNEVSALAICSGLLMNLLGRRWDRTDKIVWMLMRIEGWRIEGVGLNIIMDIEYVLLPSCFERIVINV